MREILERAANTMLKSGIKTYCYQCDELSEKEGASIYFVIEAMTAEFPEYNFISDGADKIIVLEL